VQPLSRGEGGIRGSEAALVGTVKEDEECKKKKERREEAAAAVNPKN